MTIHLDMQKFIRVLSGCFIVLILAHILFQFSKFALGHGHVLGFVEKFNVDAEMSVPTWFSSSILLCPAVLLALVSIIAKSSNDPYSVHWRILSLLFLLLSIDEAAAIHELSANPLRRALNLHGIWFYGWVIPGLLFVIAMVLFFGRFLLSLSKTTRRMFITAGILYISGALGMEMVSGYFESMLGETFRLTPAFSGMVLIEESLEMSGVIVFILSIIKYLGAKDNKLAIVMIFGKDTNRHKHSMR